MGFLTPIDDPRLEQELTVRITALAGMYPAVQLSDETIAGYCRALADVPLAALDAALAQTQQECKFFPTVAEIRERVLDATAPRRPDGPDAWALVLGEFSRVGSYGDPRFPDPLVARAVDIMGWRELCLSENQVADRAHFLQIYNALVKRERDEARLLPEFRRLRELNAAAREEHKLLEDGGTLQ
jgi:hypothetical protein